MQIDTSVFSGGLTRALVVVATAPLLATACVGNPFAPKDTAAQQKQDAEQVRLKWAQCMRDHGVNVPDPGQGGGGVQLQVQDEQKFQDAMNACKRYAPNGGNGPRKIDQKTLDQLTRFAQCMRDHGIPMQDPQTSGGGVKIEVGGEGGAVDPNSDQFKQAEQACQQYMPAGMKTKTSVAGP